LLFAGILMHINATGSIALEAISPSNSASAWLMLIGIGLNTAMPPLHAWISDAYPKATVTGAVFMSALTTKSAIYLLIRLYPGWEALIWMGAIMAIYGSIYALIVDDIREILAFSIISQLGYMVVAIGIGTEMALNGAATHAFSHILYKSLLFMAAGAVIQSTGRHRLSELGGLAGKLRWVMLLYFVGGASIAGAPLFNGFISKSMIISAAGEAHQEWIVLILLGASVGSFLHTGLKLPYFTWIAPPGGRHASHGHSSEPIDAGRIPRNMTIAMILAAGLCVGTGVYPWILYDQLPYANHYNPFTVYHLVETTQILVLAFAGFYLIKDRLAEWPGITLDVDWFYRKPGHWFGVRLVRVVAEIFSWLSDGLEYIAGALSEGFRNPLAWLHGKEYRAYRFGPAMGTAMGTVLFVSLILGIYLLFR
ncbi:MAG: hypothetical protein KDK33_19730, partial [Leptospiraceae bacterium]|nr:hypothetical protein [Leptospiraceae bacterium]